MKQTILSKNIKYLIDTKKISANKLLEITGHNSTGLIAMWKNGERQITTGDVALIANYLNLTIDELINKDLRFDNVQPTGIDKDIVKIPVLGVIPAGVPIEAIEDVLDYEEIPKDWCKGGKEFFGLLIKGDSMFPKYIDNDVVIFEKTNDFNNCDECAVMVNGDDCTFKKVLKHDHGITLQPLNSAYDIKMYSNEDIEKLPIKIIGVAKEMRRKL